MTSSFILHFEAEKVKQNSTEKGFYVTSTMLNINAVTLSYCFGITSTWDPYSSNKMGQRAGRVWGYGIYLGILSSNFYNNSRFTQNVSNENGTCPIGL